MLSMQKLNKLSEKVKIYADTKGHDKFIVKAKDGLFLVTFDSDNSGSKDIKPIKDIIQGIEIIEAENANIIDVYICGNGKVEPVVLIIDDVPESDEEMRRAIMKVKFNNMATTDDELQKLNFEDLTTEELKRIVDYWD